MDDIVDLLKIKIEKAKRELPLETVNAIEAVDWKEAILGLRNTYGFTFEQLGDLELETELLLCGLVSPGNYPKELENRMNISSAQANELVNEMNNLVFKKIREELIKNTERKKIFAKDAIESIRSSFNIPKGNTWNRNEESIVTSNEKKDEQILSSAGIKIIPDKQMPTPVASATHPTAPDPVMPPPLMQEEMLEIGTSKMPIENREEILKKIEHPEPMHTPTVEEAPHPILAQKLSGSFQAPITETEHSLENISKASMPSAGSAKSKIPNIDPYREMPE